MPQVRLQRATISYRVLGPDDSPHPPVMFVHGILVDHRLWLEVAERLARKGFRCILPDWPLGSHTIPVDESVPLNPGTVAEMVHDFIGALELRDVTLVGSDTGGGLCQLLVDAHPDSIGRLVLTNCDAFETFPPFPFTVVFATMRGPRSISLLSKLMKVPALRRSPLGFGLLLRSEHRALTASWLELTSTDRRIARRTWPTCCGPSPPWISPTSRPDSHDSPSRSRWCGVWPTAASRHHSAADSRRSSRPRRWSRFPERARS